MTVSIKRFVSLEFLLQSRTTTLFLPVLAVATIVFANFYIFIVVPNEAVMGAVQRIFYFHVASAMTTYGAIAVLLAGSIFYLATRESEWDLLAHAGASVALVLSTAVLATGMIWGHSAWNTWWRWEPRLVSFLVLWLILLSYRMLRRFTDDGIQQRNFAAVLGILAAVNVPIVIFSIKLLSHTEQLHPEVVAQQGLRDVRFTYGLLIATISTVLMSLWLLSARLTNLVLHRETQKAELI